MTTTEPNLVQALAAAGTDDLLRSALFAALRAAERRASDPRGFRDKVRAPLISALLQQVGTHTVELSTGLKFEVSTASRIEMALLLSSEDRPNHVWEPQTTKLLTTLARGCRNVIVGGAYIGDHVIPMAQIAERVHAFEPMKQAHERLLRNIQLNAANNVRPHRIGLWDKSGELLKLDGDMALASSETSPNGDVPSLTIDDYVEREQIGSVGLIMLDTEGGEEKALIGASHVLATHSPHVVFEIHLALSIGPTASKTRPSCDASLTPATPATPCATTTTTSRCTVARSKSFPLQPSIWKARRTASTCWRPRTPH